jgi:uncharacterized membrane protein YcaP (DUF421 family)
MQSCMTLLQKPFDVRTLLLGEEDWSFLPEVLFRSLVMFLVCLVCMRIIGKRGVMQDVFELMTIILLGSAAGDPMFYKKVGLLPAILVFISVVLLYKLFHYWTSVNKKIEELVEGKYVTLVQEGRFDRNSFEHTEMEIDMLIADLRLRGVSQLGQLKNAYIETSGEVSVFFYSDDEVKWGLPLKPEEYEQKIEKIEVDGFYACNFCGNTLELQPVEKIVCPLCNRNSIWVKASDEKRIR